MGVVSKTSGKGQLSNQFHVASSEGAALWYEMFAALLSQIVNVGEIRGSREVEHKIARFQDKEPFDEAAAQQELSELNEKNEALKAEIDLTARGRSISLPPDLGEAWAALAGRFFGPIDPAQVKLKHKEIVLDAKEKREQEFFTLGGRRLTSDDHAERGRKDRDDRTRTLTWLLANNPAYAALHADAVQSWRDTEDAAEDALRQIEAALEEARIEHQELLERAPLVNGKRVFRDEDGSVWTEDDDRLPDDIAAGIQWKGDEPTRNECKAGQARIDELIRSGDRMRGIQVEVADLGAELNDDEKPPSMERTEEIKDSLKEYRQEIHDERRKLGLLENVEVTPEVTRPVAANIPTL